MEKQPFFRAAMAGLGKCCTGGYGHIGVYRVNFIIHKCLKFQNSSSSDTCILKQCFK